MKKRILFVDDDPFILAGLQRLLRKARDEWEMVFVENGELALQQLSEQPFDVIVSDMRMPGMDGADLLRTVRSHFPKMVRLILSGQSENEPVYRVIGPAHQVLSKPCKKDLLRNVIRRACDMTKHLSETSENHLRPFETLTPFRSSLEDLIKRIQDPHSKTQDVSARIEDCVSSMGNLLRFLNAFAAESIRPFSNMTEAASTLGLKQLSPFVLATCAFSECSAEQLDQSTVNELLDHSVSVGQISQRIARHEGQPPEVVEQTLLAGILHNIGQFQPPNGTNERPEGATRFPVQRRGQCTDTVIEQPTSTYASSGARLLWDWGLPTPVVEAVAFQNAPRHAELTGFAPLLAVHFATAMLHEQPIDQEFIRGVLGETFNLRDWEESAGSLIGAQ